MSAQSSFGIYKGQNTKLIHVAFHKKTVDLQLPMICKMYKKDFEHYENLLSRKVKDGFYSKSLVILTDDWSTHVRIPGTNRFCLNPKVHPIIRALNSLKWRFRLKQIIKHSKVAAFSRQIHEELIQKVCHPDRIQALLDMGYDLDEILEV